MKFFVNFLKSALCLICILVSLSAFMSPTALADECSKNQRVAVPDCVDIDDIGGGYLHVYNSCPEIVELKFDKPGKDKRESIYRFSPYKIDVGNTAKTKVSCCPNYSKCSF